MRFTFVPPKPTTEPDIAQALEVCLLNETVNKCVGELMNY